MTAPSTAAPLAMATVIATLQRTVDQVRFVSTLLRNLLYRGCASNAWQSVQVCLGFYFQCFLGLFECLLYVMVMLLDPFWILSWSSLDSCSRLKEPLQSSMLPNSHWTNPFWLLNRADKVTFGLFCTSLLLGWRRRNTNVIFMWFFFWFGCDGKQEIKHCCSACNKISQFWHAQTFTSSAILHKIGYLVFCLRWGNKEVKFTHLKQLHNVRLSVFLGAWAGLRELWKKTWRFLWNTLEEIYLRVLVDVHFVLNRP